MVLPFFIINASVHRLRSKDCVYYHFCNTNEIHELNSFYEEGKTLEDNFCFH